jgi:hypothetical protein
LDEPAVLIRGVVYYKVHYDFYITFAGFGDQPVHVLHGAVVRMYAAVVADIIAIVGVWGGVYGT